MFHIYLYAADEGPLPSSFEAAAQRLQQIEGLYLEPDGSFAWADHPHEEQLHGMLYDAEERIRYVELRGRCSRTIWRRILAAIDPSLLHAATLVILPAGERKQLQAFEDSSLAEPASSRCGPFSSRSGHSEHRN